ncbi:hypothetical protein [Bacillus weihaiensis]|uniref:Uncharacterized protein n=1 Tax=Bacillus weihaiensis TaxID=1547283 RepID=A0A1L3MWW6_9BACI|nr:hypothetical protein [Bacillus weihaiensis]APH06827.1 hypothetical protein A9C19_20315 [Bacillus weihaiensis]
MKILKRIVASLVALGFVFGIGFVSVSAEEVTASGEDPNFAKVKKQDDELDPIIKEVYSKHIKEIGDVKKAALDEQGVDSVEKLAKITKQNIKDSEKQIKDKMHKEIDKVMKKYGWEQVEDTYSDDQQMTTNSTSGNISLTRSLYKSSDGYYTYYGYWDWTDGKWDSYHDIEDILAVRSTKDMTQRVSAYIYSWDNYGYSRHDRVARRSWEADGATFNVHDYLGYGWGDLCLCIIQIMGMQSLRSRHQQGLKYIRTLNITMKLIHGIRTL